MTLNQLIKELQKLDGNMKVALYAGEAKEFISDFGWETANDERGIQLFLDVSCEKDNSRFGGIGEKALKIAERNMNWSAE